MKPARNRKILFIDEIDYRVVFANIIIFVGTANLRLFARQAVVSRMVILYIFCAYENTESMKKLVCALAECKGVSELTIVSVFIGYGIAPSPPLSPQTTWKSVIATTNL